MIFQTNLSGSLFNYNFKKLQIKIQVSIFFIDFIPQFIKLPIYICNRKINVNESWNCRITKRWKINFI